jgi:hypothetical protein
LTPIRRIVVLLAAGAFLCALQAYSQDDSPSLGDVARQARLQKQQKDAASKDSPASAKDSPSPADAGKSDGTKGASGASRAASAKPSHVVTNDEVPSHVGSTLTSAKGSQPTPTSDEQPSSDNSSAADQWKSRIQAQKAGIAQLQSDIATVGDSIQYAGANCVSNCVQWNEDQKRKQDQVESMKGELEQQQKQLEETQESARKQGFGSSVYDPE